MIHRMIVLWEQQIEECICVWYTNHLRLRARPLVLLFRYLNLPSLNNKTLNLHINICICMSLLLTVHSRLIPPCLFFISPCTYSTELTYLHVFFYVPASCHSLDAQLLCFKKLNSSI